jgi:hypothetical protein
MSFIPSSVAVSNHETETSIKGVTMSGTNHDRLWSTDIFERVSRGFFPASTAWYLAEIIAGSPHTSRKHLAGQVPNTNHALAYLTAGAFGLALQRAMFGEPRLAPVSTGVVGGASERVRHGKFKSPPVQKAAGPESPKPLKAEQSHRCIVSEPAGNGAAALLAG